jgi:hypothetical protein
MEEADNSSSEILIHISMEEADRCSSEIHTDYSCNSQLVCCEILIHISMEGTDRCMV